MITRYFKINKLHFYTEFSNMTIFFKPEITKIDPTHTKKRKRKKEATEVCVSGGGG